MGTTQRPHLQAALLCERVLREKDDVLSLIRIVDRWSFKVTKTDDAEPARAILCTGVVIMKSGDYKGKKLISMHLVKLSGERTTLAAVPVVFQGEDHGVSVVANLTLTFQSDGLYWIDVELDDEPLTRMPVRVVFERVASSTTTT